MSHIIELELGPDQHIADLAALKNATERAGLAFQEGQTAFTYWNRATESCLHAITLPNGREIGITASEKLPGAFDLKVDAMDRQHCGDLLMYYQMEAARLEAERQGDIYSEQLQTDGSFIVRIDTSARMGV